MGGRRRERGREGEGRERERGKEGERGGREREGGGRERRERGRESQMVKEVRIKNSRGFAQLCLSLLLPGSNQQQP